jgi:hypothetical protein
MKGVDKTLIGIVAAIILLVIAAFTVALLRPKPTYQPEDTPEGVTHNYLLAIQQEDYTRAYSYLSPNIPGYPNTESEFVGDLENHNFQFRPADSSSTVSVGSASVVADTAFTDVSETVFYQSGLFESNQSTNDFTVKLVRDKGSGQWKIVDSSSSNYWIWCWENSTGCP